MCRTIGLAMMMAGLAVGVPATAQNTADVQRALEVLRPAVKRLDTSMQNLQQMNHALTSTHEFDIVSSVMAESLEFDGAMDGARTTGDILVNMTCPNDARYVRGVLRESALHAVNLANLSLQAINSYLTQLTTPAVVAETGKIRDLITEMRDTLRPFAGKE
jgi:hypothetical protein